jgi:hypothetical protein
VVPFPCVRDTSPVVVPLSIASCLHVHSPKTAYLVAHVLLPTALQLVLPSCPRVAQAEYSCLKIIMAARCAT